MKKNKSVFESAFKAGLSVSKVVKQPKRKKRK